jgi:hypothetical protein
MCTVSELVISAVQLITPSPMSSHFGEVFVHVSLFFHDDCRIFRKLAKFCPARDLNLCTTVVWRTAKGLASRLRLSGSRQASLHSFLQYPDSVVMIV